MSAWKPTDEQIEALACEIESSSGGWHFTPDHFDKLGPLADFQARAVAQSSAFQSIIRAAQAEAWEQGATKAWHESGDGWNGEYPGHSWQKMCIDHPKHMPANPFEVTS